MPYPSGMKQSGWPVVLFDLDGTVANTIPLIIASYRHTTSTVLGVSVSEEECRSWIGQTLADTFSRQYPDDAAELEAEYRRWNESSMARLIESYEGMGDLLADLHATGRTIAIVTSKRRQAALKTLDEVGLSGAIPVLGAAEDSQTHKPSPEPLNRALAELGRQPSECVYVGDAVVDVLAAKAAGVAQISVTWGAGTHGELAQHSPDFIADTVGQLRQIVLG